MAMPLSSSWSISSFSSPPLPRGGGVPDGGAAVSSSSSSSSGFIRCALASRTRRPGSSSSSSSSGGRSAGGSRTASPRRGPASSPPTRFPPSSPRPPPSPPKKRLWKEGEFPGISDGAAPSSKPRRTSIKNVKKKLDAREAAKAWVSTVTETLSDNIQNKQWQEALEVFQMLKEQPFYSPKGSTYMKLLVLLGKCGQAAEAQKVFDNMVEEGCGPTPELYTALLGAYCKSNLLNEAFSILTKMKSLPRCQPDVYTYSTLIKACIEASRFDLVDSLYQDMSDHMITPNTVTQNIVLSGYGRVGMYDEMEKVLSGMLGSPTCKPDVWTMNIIMSLFGSKGQIDMMEKWYERFRGIGIEPETHTFNILIGAYGKKRMYDKMSAVMDYMRKLAFPWTTSTYNNVIEAFADIGDAKNMEDAFNQMRAERMKADTKTFCCLINGFSNAGIFHKVVSSIQLAEKLGIPTNTTFYNAAISSCAKAGDLLEMERMFKQMKERNCTPDSMTYSTLIEAFDKEGMTDKIFYLQQENPDIFKAEIVAL